MEDRILIIGDSCVDVFIYCNCERLCPEAPVPVLDVVKETKNFGMAGNVMRNIDDLGYSCDLWANNNMNEITKTRYVDIKTNHMFIRIDANKKINRIHGLQGFDFKPYKAVVISDYNKGLLTTEDIEYISKIHPLTFLDTKKPLGAWAENITFIKVNRKEYLQSKPFITPKLETKIIETLGEEGCRFGTEVFPVKKVEIKNLSGAGDSFLAALVVKYLETNDIAQALTNANEVATIVVQKAGVSTIKD